MSNNPFGLPTLPPVQLLVEVQKKFAETFMERRRSEPYYVSNRAIIMDMLSDETWSEWANLHGYTAARGVLNRYAPGWNAKPKNQ